MNNNFQIKFLCVCTMLFLLSACGKKDIIVDGMKPIYATGDTIYDIRNIDTQRIVNTGTIYLWNNYLLIGEQYKGIHVIDKTDSTNPVKITFIKIYGNRNFNINNNTLYADNGRDLITINIRNIRNVVVTNILENAVVVEGNYPPNYGGFFECVDIDKGILVGWKYDRLINPKCSKE